MQIINLPVLKVFVERTRINYLRGVRVSDATYAYGDHAKFYSLMLPARIHIVVMVKTH